jgi:hypothetical protein
MRGCWVAVLTRIVDLTQNARVRMTRCTLTLTLQRNDVDTNEQAFEDTTGWTTLGASVSRIKT